MDKKHILIVLFAISLGIFLLVFPFKDEVTNKYYCDSDSDCVPEQCCHPTSCVNKAFAPDCSAVMCTMECAPGTLDCGQGSCVCQNHECKAVLE